MFDHEAILAAVTLIAVGAALGFIEWLRSRREHKRHNEAMSRAVWPDQPPKV